MSRPEDDVGYGYRRLFPAYEFGPELERVLVSHLFGALVSVFPHKEQHFLHDCHPLQRWAQWTEPVPEELQGQPVPTLAELFRGSPVRAVHEYYRTALYHLFRHEHEAYVQPLLRAGVRLLLVLSSVCRDWALACAPWFRLVYDRFALAVDGPHDRLRLRCPDLPAELCRRFLVLGTKSIVERIATIISPPVAAERRITDWTYVRGRLATECILLRPPKPRREATLDHVILRDEEQALAVAVNFVQPARPL
jgi:hypothetical protein